MQRSRADGIVCARTIDASNDVLAAAGLLMETPARPPLSMEMNTVALNLPALWPGTIRENGSCIARGNFEYTKPPVERASAYFYTTIGAASSKFDEFLAKRSQFDIDHDQIWQAYADRSGNGSYLKKIAQ